MNAPTTNTRKPADAGFWIRRLQLRPHPEGGFYREIYRATRRIPAAALPRAYQGGRPVATAIYFLLAAGQVSVFHRLRSDEQWHFYEGDPLRLTLLSPGGGRRDIRLGHPARAGRRFQALIPAGAWMGARLAPGGGYALIGCTVAPGFDFRDFDRGRRDLLLRRFPAHRSIILTLTGAP